MEKLDVMYVYDDDRFVDSICDVIEALKEEDIEDEDIVGYKVDIAEREPVMYKDFNLMSIMEMVDSYYGDDRYDEDGTISEKLEEIFKKHIDFEALNKDLEEVCLYYPNGKTHTITQEDLNYYNL